MMANHIHDALGQVRRLKTLILDKRKFTGYSGTARMIGGTIALMGTAWMHYMANGYAGLLVGWGAILALALLMNYGALFMWFNQLPAEKRTLRSISPAFDAVAPLALGGVMTAALLLRGYHDLLFGSWMCLYGLAHTSCRTILARGNFYLGLGYLACGCFFLIWPSISFMNPLPAGLVFFIGEWIGGTVFYRHNSKTLETLDE